MTPGHVGHCHMSDADAILIQIHRIGRGIRSGAINDKYGDK